MSESLKEYLDKRVTVSGAFDKLVMRPSKSGHVALLQDVEAMAEDGQTIDIGHAWVQDAGTLVGCDLEKNDRVTCSCRVHSYEKDGQTKFGFRSPTEVQIQPRPVAQPKSARLADSRNTGRLPSVPVPASGRQSCSLAATSRDVTALAKRVGGFGPLKELVEELDRHISEGLAEPDGKPLS